MKFVKSLRNYINKDNQKYIEAIIKYLESESILDLLFFFPYKYNWYLKGNIDDIYEENVESVIFGTILKIYKKKNITILLVRNDNHKDKKNFSVFFKHKKINEKIYESYYFIGKINKKENEYIMFFPKIYKFFKLYKVPIYKKIPSCPMEKLINIIKQIILDLPEIECFKYTSFKSFSHSLSMVHNIFLVDDISLIRMGWMYLKICEYLTFIDCLNKLNKNRIGKEKIKKFILKYPISLTICQKQITKDICNNLASNKATINFLQGDVGCGKTFVAFCCINKTLINNFNCCFMSPTTLLAQQHYENYKKYFPEFKCFLLSSGYKSKQYLNDLKNTLETNLPTVFFGTQNLLFEKLANIEFIVIDEQHKFGVIHRKILMDLYPTSDVLFLSATPIPRTLFLLQAQQFNLFTIKTLPFIKNITTHLIKDKEEILNYIFSLSKKEKILWINTSINNYQNKNGVISTYEYFKQNNIETFLLHGQLSEEEKNNIINNFSKGILVSTICVETGIDIDKLNCIVIEDAQQFGLSTLHQLRGRVGRKGEKSDCFLIDKNLSERLKILKEVNDGFKISEIDLQERGFGNFFDLKQWGLNNFKTGKFSLSLFKIANDIFIKKKYNIEIINELANFFFKITNINY